jgi:uncharacterized protein (TIGR02466 family)
MIIKDHVEVVPIFPIPVYFAICQDDIKKDIDFLESTHEWDDKDKDITDEYGTISLDTKVLDRPELVNLRKWILQHVNNYAKQVLAWQFKDISITQSWVSIKRKAEKHTYHMHPNSLISGVFYWNEDPIESISFLRPRKFTNFEIERDETLNAPYAFDHHNFSPVKNTLILFPSETQHGVAINKADSPRKSLAFNTFIFEKLGRLDNLTELDLTKD